MLFQHSERWWVTEWVAGLRWLQGRTFCPIQSGCGIRPASSLATADESRVQNAESTAFYTCISVSLKIKLCPSDKHYTYR
jgi:hypothetical protein